MADKARPQDPRDRLSTRQQEILEAYDDMLQAVEELHTQKSIDEGRVPGYLEAGPVVAATLLLVAKLDELDADMCEMGGR